MEKWWGRADVSARWHQPASLNRLSDPPRGVLPTITTEVLVEATGWGAAVGNLERLCANACQAIVHEGPKGLKSGTVAVLFTDDDAVRRLNRDFRDQDKPTNVLSFPADIGERFHIPEGEVLPLGDIALALETCLHEAKRDGKTIEDHVTHLVVHGILHISGYDHIDDRDALEMERLERSILGRLGIGDPY